MAKLFVFNYNGIMTSWNGNIKTFLNYPKEKQIYMMYALDNAPSEVKQYVRDSLTLAHHSNDEAQDLLKFIKSGTMGKAAPEISIVACLLAKRRGENCSICISPMTDMGDMVVATLCRHVFCTGCIVQWAQKSKTCPVCRGNTEHTLIHLGPRDKAIAEELDNGPPIVLEHTPVHRPLTRSRINSVHDKRTTERVFRELNLAD